MGVSKVALVTGGTGFVGRRLVDGLLEAGYTVRVIARRSAKTRENKIRQLKFYEPTDVDIEAAAIGVTHFFNFAVVYDRPSIENQTIEDVNIALPLKIMAMLKGGSATVTCVLADTFFRKFRPAATQQIRYTQSKIDLAARVDQFKRDSSLRVALLQIEQVYGPGDAFDKVMPAITKQLIGNVPNIALTSGIQFRDFIFVDDVVDAALTVAESEWCGIVDVQCGSGIATQVRRVFEEIHKITKSKTILGFGELKSNQEISSSTADINWLVHRGWKPQVDLSDGLKMLVADVRERLLSE